jgi:transcriptional regulator with XRE-family HTH domain
MNFTEAGALIRNARRKAGMTQAELAKPLGMDRATISRIENGVIEELGVRKLAQLCDRLGLEVTVRRRQAIGTLHDAYARNKAEREAAFRETDAALARLKAKPETND